MATVASPPNPSLVAIILVIQSRSGPRFVFHYPPSPASVPRTAGLQAGYESSDSDQGIWDDTSDEELSFGEHGTKSSMPRRGPHADSEGEETHAVGRAPWDHLLGMDTSALEKLLMPSDRSWHKKKFEVGLNDLVFLGWPLFIREDGTWQKRKRSSKQSKAATKTSVAGGRSNSSLPEENGDDGSGNDQAGKLQGSPSGPANVDGEGGDGPELKTFNLVFVLNPPILEYGLRIREMYDHVVKKFARALKWEQARSNYIWVQSALILKAKAQARHQSS